MLIQLYYATHLLDLDFYIVFFTSCVIGYIVKITNLQIYLRNVAITHVKFNKIVVINFCASRNRCTDKFILLLQMCVECHGLPNGISIKLLISN